MPAEDPAKGLRDAVDLIVMPAVGEGQDFALELAEPGCGSGDQHMAGLDPCRLHRHARMMT